LVRDDDGLVMVPLTVPVSRVVAVKSNVTSRTSWSVTVVVNESYASYPRGTPVVARRNKSPWTPHEIVGGPTQ
jgi:hypothetical protein